MRRGPALPSALHDLALVRAPSGRGVYASRGDNFRDAVFARDALEVAEDVLQWDPDLCHEVILALARLQGTVDTPSGPLCSEEEPGRIHHESRERVIDGRVVSLDAQNIIDALAQRWGGDSQRMTYYGSMDATPLFVRVVAAYCARMDSTAILDERLINKDGISISVRDSVRAAADWVARTVERSPHGVLEHHRRNPDGIENQSWRDSKVSLVHPDGELAPPSAPRAPIEVQGLAYDAFCGAATLLDDPTWHDKALDLRDAVLRQYWMPNEKFFASALDRDPDGRSRQVRTISAAAAELLDSGIFDELTPAARHRYVGGLVTRISGAEFVTEAGVRTLSQRHTDATGYWSYQGSNTVWHKQTFDIAHGLRRQGMPRIAEQLENRLLNVCNAMGEHSEYIYVDKAGTASLDPRNTRALASPLVIAATNVPDAGQTWTVSAALAIKRRRGTPPAPDVKPEVWARQLDVTCFNRMPRIAVITSRAALAALYAAAPATIVDTTLGKEAERAIVARNQILWNRGDGGTNFGIGA